MLAGRKVRVSLYALLLIKNAATNDITVRAKSSFVTVTTKEFFTINDVSKED